MTSFAVLTSISTYLRISASRVVSDLARLPNERSRRDMSISGLYGVLVDCIDRAMPSMTVYLPGC